MVDGPTAVTDTETTAEDTPLTIFPLANDVHGDGTAMFLSAITQPMQGTAAISGTSQVVYTPTLDYNGADQFTYEVSDGVFTDTATINLTITAVNDPPVGVTDVYTTLQDVPITLSPLLNDIDVDSPSSSLYIFQTTQASGGSVTISGTTQLSSTPIQTNMGSIRSPII